MLERKRNKKRQLLCHNKLCDNFPYDTAVRCDKQYIFPFWILNLKYISLLCYLLIVCEPQQDSARSALHGPNMGATQ